VSEQWRRQEFLFGCYSIGSRPWVGFRGDAPVGVPPQASVCRHWLQILTADTIKFWKFRTNHLLVLDEYVSRWGLSDKFGGLSPLAHAWPATASESLLRIAYTIQTFLSSIIHDRLYSDSEAYALFFLHLMISRATAVNELSWFH